MSVFTSGAWTATSNAAWLHTTASGSGDGTAAFSFDANSGAARTGTLTIAGLTLTVDQAAASISPTITSANNTTFTVGTAGTFTVTTTGFPVAGLSKSGALPSGVTFTDNGNGTATLAGTPAAGAGGTYAFTITANNGVSPNATQNFTLTVNQAPAITSANAATFTPNVPNAFTVTATGFPAPALSEGGALPSGVTFTNNGNGTATLAGTPAAGTSGSYPITFTAANGVGSNFVQNFTLTVSAVATTVYVDQSFAGTTPGQNPATAPTGLSLQFGYNAFADIPTALVNVASGGTVVVFADTNAYPGFTVNNPVTFDVNVNPQNGSGSGTLAISSPVTLNANTVFTQTTITPGSSPLGPAALFFNDNIVTGGTPVSLTINGNASKDVFQAIGTTTDPLSSVDVASSGDAILQQDVATTGTQTYDAPLQVEETGTLTLTATTVTFGSTLISNARHGSLTIAGAAVFDGAVGGSGNDLTNLQVNGATTIDTASIEVSGNQTYTGAVTLAAATTLTSTTNGNVTFGSTVDSGAGGPFGLNIATSAGIITFTGAVGSSAPVGAINFTGFGWTLDVNGGSVNTTGFTQNYGQGAVVLGADTQFTGSLVTFGTLDGTQSGKQNLTITGNGQFPQAVGGVTPLASVTVTGTTVMGPSGGSTPVTTTGNQTYQGGVRLEANGGTTATFTSTNGLVRFESTLDDGNGGDELFVVDGNAEFDGVVGGIAALASISVSGTTLVNTSMIITTKNTTLTPISTGDQVYNGAVTLATNATFQSNGATPGSTGNGLIQFPSTLDDSATGTHTLTIMGDVQFDGAVGGTAALSSLTVTGATEFGAGGGGMAITTKGNQDYQGTVTLNTDGRTTITLTAGTATFESTIDESSAGLNVDLVVAGNAVFGGAVGATNPLAILTVSGSAALNATSVATTGPQTYGAVTLGSNVTLTSSAVGNISFNGTVQSPGHHNLTVTTSGITTFGGAVGGDNTNSSSLGNLTTGPSGTTVLSGGSVNTTGFTQTYGNTVTLGSPFTILAGTADFNAGLALLTDKLQIAGTLNFTTTTTLNTTITGTASTQIGHIVVGGGNTTYGNATLVLNYSGFTPAPGDSFDIVSNGGFGIDQFINAPAPGPTVIQGIPYLITYSGTDGGGDFILTAAQAPAITSANSTTFTSGTAGSFTVTATGFPAPTFSLTGAPAWLSINSTSGALTGMPPNLGGGPYSFPFTITATNGVTPDGTQNFTLTVNQAPAITSAASTTFTVGTAGSFTVTATGNPAPTLSESGTLPTGVTFNAATGTLSGTAAAGTGGIYKLDFTASNGVQPNVTQDFTLTVNEAPAITSAAQTSFIPGVPGSFELTTTGFPLPTLSIASGTLPPGITLNGLGVLSGTAPLAGTYTVTVAANNGVGQAATQTLTIAVAQPISVISGNGGNPAAIAVFDNTGALLFQAMPFGPTFAGPVRTAIVDVNGGPEVVAAAGPGGGPEVVIYNGQTGAVLNSFFAYNPAFTGGVVVAAGTLNSDAIIVTGAGAGGGPQVNVYNAADDSLRLAFMAYDPSFIGGVQVTVGNVAGGGNLDVITGAGPGGGPQVTAFDDTTGQVVLSLFAYSPSFSGGVYVAAGDVSNDGHADLIVSPGSGGGPQVNVFSGLDGSVLMNLLAYNASFTGGVRVASVDVNGDGYADVVTSAGVGNATNVHAFSGLDGSNLDSFFADNPNFGPDLFNNGN